MFQNKFLNLIPDNKITGKIIYLGYYESEYNWDDDTDNQSVGTFIKELLMLIINL